MRENDQNQQNEDGFIENIEIINTNQSQCSTFNGSRCVLFKA
jgi:hypothetical protein